MPTLRSCLSCVTILPQLCHDPASVVSRSCLSCVTILTRLCHDPDSVVSRSCLSWATILPQLGHNLPHTCQPLTSLQSLSKGTSCTQYNTEPQFVLSGIGLRSQWNRTTTSVPSKLKCGCTHFPDQYVVEERKIQKTFEFIWWNHRKVVPLHPQFRNRGHTVLTMIVQNAPLAQLVEQLTLNQWV